MEADRVNDIKRRLRRLKALEVKLRFGGGPPPAGARLVWDDYFDLRGAPGEGRPGLPEKGGELPGGQNAGTKNMPKEPPARCTLARAAAMGREGLRAVADDYFAALYYTLYKERGLAGGGRYSPSALAALGLPPGAGEAAVKKRFRQLALTAHPDAGGTDEAFIALMEAYRGLEGPGEP